MTDHRRDHERSRSAIGRSSAITETCSEATRTTDEANHADDEAQAGHGRRDSCRGVHAAHGADAGRAGRGDGSSAQACQRVVQRPPERDRADCAHPGARVRQQRRLLAERAAAQRSVGGDEQSPRARADRTRDGRSVPRRDRCHTARGTMPFRSNRPFRSREPRRRQLPAFTVQPCFPNPPWPAKPWPP